MIDGFVIHDFKSFDEVEVRLPRIGILIGANASGKTNALEGLRLATTLAAGVPLSTLASLLARDEALVRGSVPGLFARRPLFGLDVGALLWAISVDSADGALAVWGENLTDFAATTRVPYLSIERAAEPGSHDVQVAYNNFAKGGKKPQITCVNQQSIISQCRSPARYGAAHGQSRRFIPAACDRVINAANQVLFVDSNPGAMRGYAFRNEARLASDGRNLSAVVARLVTEGAKDEVLRFVRALPEQQIVDLDFVETPRAEVMLQLVESFGGRREAVDAPSLSDGTLRILAIAAALLSVERGTLVVVEEIDNGLHPARARSLLENIYAVAARRDIQVLLSTHNPALLNAVPDESFPEVLYCYRDRESGWSRISRLDALPRYAEVATSGRLGDIVASGRLEALLGPAAEVPDDYFAKLASG